MPRERSNAVSSKNAPFTGAKPSKKPIIGSHRTKSLIGGHRTQQVLDMQGMIGNQATQKFVPTVPKPTLGSHRIKTQIGGHRTKPTLESKPVTENPTTPKQLSDSLQSKPLPQGYVPFDTGETKDAGSSFDWNLGSGATTAPKSKPLPKGYVPFKDDDKSDDHDFDDDWDSKSISKSGSTTPTTNTSPSSAVGAITPEQGVFPARVREDLFDEEPDDFDDDSDDDYDDDSDNANKDELSGLIAQSLQPAGAGSSFALEKNKESEFDKDMLYGGGIRGVDLNSTTFYANESQRASYARGFDKSGKMINATDGKSLDTMGALESSTVGAKADRHIFTMNALGEFHSMDAVKENSDRSKRVHDQRKQDLKDLKDKPQLQAELRNMQLPSMERIHHSTFNAGDDIAGAGELQVRDGQVELLSDASGHYKPGSKQMVQTVQQLEKNNVPIEQLGVEFVGKPEFQYELDYLTGEDKVDPTTGKKVRRRDVDGNLMPKMQNGKQSFTKNMQVSALELLGYADHVPDAAEERMRDAHDQKNSMLRELLIKTQRHDPIAYDYRGDVQSKHASVMEELLAKRKKAAPVPDLPQEKYFGYGSISNLPDKKLVVDDNERSSRSSLPVAGDNNVKTSEADEVWGAAASNSAAIKDGGKAQARSKGYKKETAQGGSNAYNSAPLLNGSNAYNSAPLMNSSMSYNKSNGYNKPISRGYTGSKPFSYKDFDEDSYD